MCDVPTVAVFCTEFIERFPSMLFQMFLHTFFYHSTGLSYYQHNHTFHAPHSCSSIYKFLYFNFFSASFCVIFLFSAIATSVTLHVFSFWSQLIYLAYFETFCIRCVLPVYVTPLHLHFHMLAFVYECVFCHSSFVSMGYYYYCYYYKLTGLG